MRQKIKKSRADETGRTIKKILRRLTLLRGCDRTAKKNAVRADCCADKTGQQKKILLRGLTQLCGCDRSAQKLCALTLLLGCDRTAHKKSARPDTAARL
jgi:hypothetical protein